VAKLTKEVVNTIFARMPNIKQFLSSSLRKQVAFCPFKIVRGTMNDSEAGYQPQGAQPRDFTNFSKVITGFDPIIVEWEDSVIFPYDGTLDQRHQQIDKITVRGLNSVTKEEKTHIYPLGSVFQYDNGQEFQLPRRYIEKPLLVPENSPYKHWKEVKDHLGQLEEPWDEYQKRFEKALGDELDRLVKPENKQKDKWGREYYEQLQTKYIIRKYQTGRYYSAYFLSDETTQTVKQWLGNQTLASLQNQKTINLLILNTDDDQVFYDVTADGFEGNRGFFDRIDDYSFNLFRVPEFDLTYDLDNLSLWLWRPQTERLPRKYTGCRQDLIPNCLPKLYS